MRVARNFLMEREPTKKLLGFIPVMDHALAGQSVNVLKLISMVRSKGISVILINHNVNHAYPVADSFTLLNRGQSMALWSSPMHDNHPPLRH